ncbi:hypothetical protein [Streptomyces sp. NPDC017940]
MLREQLGHTQEDFAEAFKVVMLDDVELSPQARRELEGIQYAIRLEEA